MGIEYEKEVTLNSVPAVFGHAISPYGFSTRSDLHLNIHHTTSGQQRVLTAGTTGTTQTFTISSIPANRISATVVNAHNTGIHLRLVATGTLTDIVVTSNRQHIRLATGTNYPSSLTIPWPTWP
jgi:hypothetical protein